MTDRVVRELDETLRAVHNAHGARSSLAVFVAGPAPLAFFLGNAINPRAVGPVQVFEYDGEYKLAFELPYPPVPDRNRVVLFQSLPSGEPRLELDREIRDLRLGGSAGNDRLEISDVPGARPSDLLGALRSRPTGAIHFSGHGASGALVLEAEDRSPRLVSIAELAESIRIAAPSARLVVLSACYTATDARALLAHVECVVAMRGPIHDGDARRFAVAFYAHLGVGESVKDAFDAACHSMKLDRMTDSRASRARDVLPAGAESTSEAEDPRLVERDPGCARSVYLVRRH
jgi:hypothetical protein